MQLTGKSISYYATWLHCLAGFLKQFMTLLSILSFQLHQSFMAMMTKPVKTLELYYPIISFPTSANGIYCFIKNTPKILKNNCNHSKNFLKDLVYISYF